MVKECSDTIKLQIILDIAKTLDLMHQNDIVHLQLKLSSILLTKDMKPILKDFGRSRRGKYQYINTFQMRV